MSEPLVPEDHEFDGSPTDLLDTLGQELWGPDWAGRMANLVNVNLRTCQRLAAAAKVRTERPSAEHVLRAARERLAALALAADPTAGNLQDACEQDPDVARWLIWRAIFGQMTKRDVITDKQDDEVAGPYTVGDLRVILDVAADNEHRTANMTKLILDAHNAENMDEARTILRLAAVEGANMIGAMIGRTDAGKAVFATEGDPAFSEVAFDHAAENRDAETKLHGADWFTSAMLIFDSLPLAEKAAQILRSEMQLVCHPATMLDPRNGQWTPALLLADDDWETPMIIALSDAEDELSRHGIEVVAAHEAQPRLEVLPELMGARPSPRG